MVVNGKSDSNTNLVEAMEPTALDEEKNRPKFHTSSSMAKQSSIVGTRVAMKNSHGHYHKAVCIYRLSEMWLTEQKFLKLFYDNKNHLIPFLMILWSTQIFGPNLNS